MVHSGPFVAGRTYENGLGSLSASAVLYKQTSSFVHLLPWSACFIKGVDI